MKRESGAALISVLFKSTQFNNMETATLHKWHELNQEGDTTVEWDPDDSNQVEMVKKSFNDMKAKGYRFFEKKKGGEPGRRIDVFDPSIEKMVMVKQIVAG